MFYSLCCTWTTYILRGLSVQNIFLILSSSLQFSLMCQILSNITTLLYKFVFPILGIPTSYSKVTTNYQRNYQRRDDETASSIHSVRQTERNAYFNSAEPRRSAYVFYRNTRVIEEPKCNGYTGEFLLTQNS